MISRIRHILEQKNLSPSRFADDIGVPRSTISHILSERNKPSLEVIQKILIAYPDIPVDWLLLGKGVLNVEAYTLFGTEDQEKQLESSEGNEEVTDIEDDTKDDGTSLDDRNQEVFPIESLSKSISKRDSKDSMPIEKVVILYSNGTFSEYKPSG